MFDRIKLNYITHQEKGMPDRYGLKFIKNNKASIIYTYDITTYEIFKKRA